MTTLVFYIWDYRLETLRKFLSFRKFLKSIDKLDKIMIRLFLDILISAKLNMLP
jgi:hypothetical protein